MKVKIMRIKYILIPYRKTKMSTNPSQQDDELQLKSSHHCCTWLSHKPALLLFIHNQNSV